MTRQLQVLETARIKVIGPGPGVAEITESPGNSGVISYSGPLDAAHGGAPFGSRSDGRSAQAHLTLRMAVLLSLIHISEPTRLGMISYAVFCLKKKKTKERNHTYT